MSAPHRPSYPNTVMLEPISLMTYANFPFGENARCRGPAPGATDPNAGSFGNSLPDFASSPYTRT